MKFAYLDKGFVELLGFMGSDREIAEAAWVSSDRAENRSDDAVCKVIRYMARHNHWTPFGQTAIKLRFRIPIFVARQLMRSNVGIVWNEESRRYVDSLPEFHVPREWRERSTSMKQGSGGVFKDVIDFEDRNCSPTDLLHVAYKAAIGVYAAMIDAGVAPEQARIVLPVATYTTIVATFNVASLSRVYRLRADPHAQAEIRELATCIDSCVKATRAFPFSWDEMKGGEA